MKALLKNKYLLLLKAAFGEKEEAALALLNWTDKFNNNDLDATTRAILPMLIQKFNEKIKNHNHYQLYYQQTWLNNLIKFDYFRKILVSFSKEDIPICLLKGSAMLLHFYKNMGMRPLGSDIDILISRKHLKKAMQILENQYLCSPASVFKHPGYKFANHIKADNAQILKYHHAITYHTPHGSLDLHWQLSPCIQALSFDALKETMQPIYLEQERFFVLSNEEHFMHTFLHGASQIANENKLWWLIDLCYLLNNKKHSLNWDKIFALSHHREIEPHLEHTLSIIGSISSSLLPISITEKIHALKISNNKKFIFSMLHHNKKIIRQIAIYATIFKHKTEKLTPLQLIKFIMVYFGFTSYKLMIKNIFLRL